MLFVINCYRPLSRNVSDVIEIMHEIESAGKIKFTGIINNSNLGTETTAEDILKSLPYADEVSKLAGLPVVMTTVADWIFDELSEKVPNLFPLALQKKIIE